MKPSVYPLSPLQQGLLFHGVLDPGAEGQYASQVLCELDGALDRAAFEVAWRRLLARHAVLRTAFVWEGVDEAVQVVLPEVELPLVWHDLSALDSGSAERAAADLVAADRRRPFDFRRPPLMRLAALRLGEARHRLIWSFHHLVMDGWSEALLVEEFAHLYRAATGAGGGELPPVRPYGAFANWVRGRDLGEAERHWRRALAGAPVPTPLPLRDAPPDAGRRVETEGERLPAAESDALRRLARARRLTPSTLVQAAWATVLAHASGTRDVVFGVAVSGRPPELSGVERMIGPFVNTLPARVRLPAGAPVGRWLEEIQRQGAEARRFEHSPLVEVQRWSAAPAGRPLFESLYAFQSGPAGDGSAASPSAEAGGLVLRRMDVRGGATSFPLTLEIEPGTRFHLMVNADRVRVPEETSGGLLAALVAVLRELPSRVDGTVDGLLEVAAEVERTRRETSRRRLESLGRAGLRRARRRDAAPGDDGRGDNGREEVARGA